MMLIWMVTDGHGKLMEEAQQREEWRHRAFQSVLEIREELENGDIDNSVAVVRLYALSSMCYMSVKLVPTESI